MIDLDRLIKQGFDAQRVPVPYGEPRTLMDAFQKDVKETDGIVDHIVAELDAAAETKDWRRMDDLLVLARVVPDQSMLPALRLGIYGTIDRGPLVEDIISQIVDIWIANAGEPDVDSIPALRHAVYAFPDWDADARWATKKALDALAGLSPEANAIVADIAQTGTGEERDYAQDIIDHLQK